MKLAKLAAILASIGYVQSYSLTVCNLNNYDVKYLYSQGFQTIRLNSCVFKKGSSSNKTREFCILPYNREPPSDPEKLWYTHFHCKTTTTEKEDANVFYGSFLPDDGSRLVTKSNEQGFSGFSRINHADELIFSIPTGNLRQTFTRGLIDFGWSKSNDTLLYIILRRPTDLAITSITPKGISREQHSRLVSFNLHKIFHYSENPMTHMEANLEYLEPEALREKVEKRPLDEILNNSDYIDNPLDPEFLFDFDEKYDKEFLETGFNDPPSSSLGRDHLGRTISSITSLEDRSPYQDASKDYGKSNVPTGADSKRSGDYYARTGVDSKLSSGNFLKDTVNSTPHDYGNANKYFSQVDKAEYYKGYTPLKPNPETLPLGQSTYYNHQGYAPYPNSNQYSINKGSMPQSNPYQNIHTASRVEYSPQSSTREHNSPPGSSSGRSGYYSPEQTQKGPSYPYSGTSTPAIVVKGVNPSNYDADASYLRGSSHSTFDSKKTTTSGGYANLPTDLSSRILPQTNSKYGSSTSQMGLHHMQRNPDAHQYSSRGASTSQEKTSASPYTHAFPYSTDNKNLLGASFSLSADTHNSPRDTRTPTAFSQEDSSDAYLDVAEETKVVKKVPTFHTKDSPHSTGLSSNSPSQYQSSFSTQHPDQHLIEKFKETLSPEERSTFMDYKNEYISANEGGRGLLKARFGVGAVPRGRGVPGGYGDTEMKSVFDTMFEEERNGHRNRPKIEVNDLVYTSKYKDTTPAPQKTYEEKSAYRGLQDGVSGTHGSPQGSTGNGYALNLDAYNRKVDYQTTKPKIFSSGTTGVQQNYDLPEPVSMAGRLEHKTSNGEWVTKSPITGQTNYSSLGAEQRARERIGEAQPASTGNVKRDIFAPHVRKELTPIDTRVVPTWGRPEEPLSKPYEEEAKPWINTGSSGLENEKKAYQQNPENNKDSSEMFDYLRKNNFNKILKDVTKQIHEPFKEIKSFMADTFRY